MTRSHVNYARDLGGLVVIDFIDMESQNQRESRTVCAMRLRYDRVLPFFEPISALACSDYRVSAAATGFCHESTISPARVVTASAGHIRGTSYLPCTSTCASSFREGHEETAAIRTGTG
jgi:Ribonuclease G/E